MMYISMGFDKGVVSFIYYHSTRQNTFVIPKVPTKVFWNKQTTTITVLWALNKILQLGLWYASQVELWALGRSYYLQGPNTQSNTIKCTHFFTPISLKSQNRSGYHSGKPSPGTANAVHISWSLKD